MHIPIVPQPDWVLCARGLFNSKMDNDALRSVFSDASRAGWSLRSDVQVRDFGLFFSYFTGFDMCWGEMSRRD